MAEGAPFGCARRCGSLGPRTEHLGRKSRNSRAPAFATKNAMSAAIGNSRPTACVKRSFLAWFYNRTVLLTIREEAVLRREQAYEAQRVVSNDQIGSDEIRNVKPGRLRAAQRSCPRYAFKCWNVGTRLSGEPKNERRNPAEAKPGHPGER